MIREEAGGSRALKLSLATDLSIYLLGFFEALPKEKTRNFLEV